MEKLYLTWSIINFIAVLATKVNYDRNRRLDDKKIYHKKELFVSVICGLPALYMLSKLTINLYVGIPITAALLSFVFWFLFDGFYAKFVPKISQSWWWTGSEDGKDDAKTDNFLQGLKEKTIFNFKFSPLLQHKIIKIGGIILTLFLYMCIYKK